jgi:hypothetical protein
MEQMVQVGLHQMVGQVVLLLLVLLLAVQAVVAELILVQAGQMVLRHLLTVLFVLIITAIFFQAVHLVLAEHTGLMAVAVAVAVVQV